MIKDLLSPEDLEYYITDPNQCTRDSCDHHHNLDQRSSWPFLGTSGISDHVEHRNNFSLSDWSPVPDGWSGSLHCRTFRATTADSGTRARCRPPDWMPDVPRWCQPHSSRSFDRPDRIKWQILYLFNIQFLICLDERSGLGAHLPVARLLAVVHLVGVLVVRGVRTGTFCWIKDETMRSYAKLGQFEFPFDHFWL